MTDSPVQGIATVEIEGKEYEIIFDWAAQAKINKLFPGDFDLMQPQILAQVAALGLEARHPEMTAERIFEASPPTIPTMHAVERAYKYALWGDVAPPDETESAEGDGKKKRFLSKSRLKALLRMS